MYPPSSGSFPDPSNSSFPSSCPLIVRYEHICHVFKTHPSTVHLVSCPLFSQLARCGRPYQFDFGLLVVPFRQRYILGLHFMHFSDPCSVESVLWKKKKRILSVIRERWPRARTESLRPLDESHIHPLENPWEPYQGGADVLLNLELSLNNTTDKVTINNASFLPPPMPVLLQILSGKRWADKLLSSGSVDVLPPNKVIVLSIPVLGAPGAPVSVFEYEQQ